MRGRCLPVPTHFGKNPDRVCLQTGCNAINRSFANKNSSPTFIKIIKSKLKSLYLVIRSFLTFFSLFFLYSYAIKDGLTILSGFASGEH